MSVTGSRLYFIDAMRAVLMMLGVVIHSANVFSSDQNWLIYADNSWFLASYLSELIHIFRMPAFFVVSGYFCLFTLKRYGVSKFWKVRSERLLVPFFTVAIVINTGQSLLLDASGWRELEWASYLMRGQYVSHLWFLINLMIYFTVIALFAKLFGRIFYGIGHRLEVACMRLPMVIILLLLPFASIAVLATNHLGFPLYAEYYGVIKLYSLLKFLPFFLFGIVLALNKELLARFAGIPLWLNFTALVLAAWLQSSAVRLANENVILTEYSHALLTWVSVTTCFSLFRRFFNHNSKFWMTLSGASYSVYLFHHVLVIAFGLLLVKVNCIPWLGFMLLVILVPICTLWLHDNLITRLPMLSYLFNGK
ncbi:acyltransferase family protein [Neiella marina]|uniref:Acyltransferase family protein n=1 Tax=Neiella holothuriorum TaxID=2870530 RepID=A0ABS7EH10_9GAMM|nr:acyltransferase family protein [Neiella holothuriorum]MBW8191628.1 acyltransferase family protein [Neiella holothuriorum]